VIASRTPDRGLGLLAGAAALGVANLYYAQPLAALMASSLGISASGIGSCLTACQLGYGSPCYCSCRSATAASGVG
jgi:hypothetical protein